MSTKIDLSKKRLYIFLKGYFTLEDAQSAADQILKALEQIDSEFDVVTDISSVKPATPMAAQEIWRVHEGLKKKNVRKTIRIVGDKLRQLVVKNQIDRISMVSGIEAVDVTSIEEADEILDAL